MIIESIRTVLDSQKVKGITDSDILQILNDVVPTKTSVEYGTITFFGDNHNPTTARIVRDKSGVVEVYVTHNGKPLNNDDDPFTLFSAQLDSLRNCGQQERMDGLLEYVKDIVERAIIEALLNGILTEAEFHSYTPRYQLHNNRGETEHFLCVALDVAKVLLDDYSVRHTDRLDGDTEEAFDRLFEAISGIKKNILVSSEK